MKVKIFDNIPKHYHKNPEKLFNQTFLVWLRVLIRKCWSKYTGKLQNTVPCKWFFFQIKYLFIFYTVLREFYKWLLVQKYKDYMDVE